MQEKEIEEYIQDRMSQPFCPRPLTEEEFNELKARGYEHGTYEEYLKAVQE